jgi:hypothetical protein
LLDSVVKERLVKIFRLNRGAHSTAASVAVKRLFSEVFKVSFVTSTTCASDHSVAGGEFYSDSILRQASFETFFTTSNVCTLRTFPALLQQGCIT